MASEADIRELLALHRQTGGDPRCLARLLNYFGSAAAARREATLALLLELGLPEKMAEAMCRDENGRAMREVDQDLTWLSRPDHHLILADAPAYPSQLLEIHDPPPLLFCDGNTDLLEHTQVAVVGSRRMSDGGRKIAMQLAGDLCRSGLTVTSGLARGVDAAAHRGALAAGGETVAVLGSGCDVIYPAMNQRLAHAIRNQGGLIISEFPLRLGARNYHFPQRNRIVTGLSVGTLVVEAALRSGSLISARLAMEQGREVFAVPGSVLSPLSAGCHKLIRDGAKLTEKVEDILEELAGFVALPGTGPSALNCDERQLKLLACLGAEPVSIDALVEACGMPVDELLGLVIDLEIDGLVAGGAGGYSLTPECARRLAEAQP